MAMDGGTKNGARPTIERELETMGFDRQRVGFEYAAEAIWMLSENTGKRLHVSRDLYPMLAEKYSTTRCGIERGLRNAIEAVFLEADADVLLDHYPFDYDEETGRPTNGEFIKNMASLFREC